MSDIGCEELTENVIDNAQFAEILMLCDQYGIEYGDNDEITEEQLKSKLKEFVPSEKEKSKAQFHVYMLATNDGFIEDIEEIAKNVQKGKEKALKLFSKLMDLVSDEEFNNQILLRKELEKRYKDFKDKIQQRCKDIEEKECTIVVTGETSAGKSSVMNLILGDDILPVSALQCTGAICRLRYSEIKKVVVKPRRGEEKKFELSSKEKFKETVKEYTRVVPGDEKDAIEFVDLYWPIPLKLRNVVFVDTPGVSDNDTLSQRLYDYLPNAMAFIYILNSTNDGGIQRDRIVRILERQKSNRCKVFNPETTLFICNKWDEVGMEEQDKVKTYIKRQLASTWPDLHNAPLITFSVKDITQTIRRNIRCCEYEELHSRLLSLIRVGFRDELMSHLRWIREFAERIIDIVESQVCFFPKNETERNEYIAKIKTELAKVEADFQKIKRKMEEEMDDKIMILTKRLFNHIHSLTVRERISTWSLDDCPEVKTGDPKQIYQELITTRLQAEIVLWYNEGNISSELESGIKAFEDYLLKLERDFNISRENMHKKSASEKGKFSSVYSKHGKREVPGRNYFQWIFSIASYFSNLSQRWRCNKDRFKYMKECTEAVLSNLTKTDLSEVIKADLVIVHENISSTFEQFLQNEYSFLKELESAPALPGNNKTMETIKSSCVTLLEEIDSVVL